ncbi:MAG: FAD-binding oxidoreductase [Gemmatimonadota bacterium]
MNPPATLSQAVSSAALDESVLLDWSQTGCEPMAVVSPSDTEECAQLMAWASTEGVGVLPVGAGSLLQSVDAERSWVALSTHRLRAIHAYEAADLTLTAGAGASMHVIDAALRENQQWAPFDSPRIAKGTLGGLVSVGWSGPLWSGYGELRNHVLGATLVTGDGRVLSLGGRVVKNVAGFDALKLTVGGRGAFGVITSVCVRAFPEPAVDRLLVLAASTIGELAGAAQKAATAPIVPASLALVDQLPGSDTAGMVVRLHGAKSTVDADQRSLEAHLSVPLAEVPWSGDFLASVADRGCDSTVVVRVSTLPSRLPGLCSMLEGQSISGLLLDAYGARGRIAFESDEAAVAADLGRVVTELGGALSIERAPSDSPVWALESRGSAGERMLADRLHRVFDPAEVMWPTHS